MCNTGREDCQARADLNISYPAPQFTSFARSYPSTPLYPFGHGLSYSSVAVVGLEVAAGPGVGGGFTLGDTVATTAILSPADMVADFAVALFGEFLQCDGSASSVPALPRRTLLAFAKVAADQEGSTRVPLSFALDPLRVPGVERQAFPGLLRVWAGDGGPCVGCPSSMIDLVLPSGGCVSPTEREL